VQKMGDGSPEDDTASLFKGLTFFLAREVNRESLLFVIRSFGGEVGWDGPQSPFGENQEGITHHICDRPTQKHQFLSVTYLQPQWVYDCVNFRVLIPPEEYLPGLQPPPHCSPFQEEDEGYVPDYALKLQSLQDAARGTSSSSSSGVAKQRNAAEEPSASAPETEEDQYAAELAAEVAGVSYSQARMRPEEISDDDVDEDEEEDEDEKEKVEVVVAKGKKGKKGDKGKKPLVSPKEKDLALKAAVKARVEETEGGDLMREALLPRKQKRLYEAMQIGIARKQAKVEELVERKKKLVAKNS